ncbi:MAG: sigma-70 family RNA polymerase sigma factor [Thermomicrobiales bacterium]
MTESGNESGRTDRTPSDARAIERQNAAQDAALDAELVRRVADGDHDALSTLYDRHGATVYSVALSVLRDPKTAEDVTQDVFVTLWTQPDRFNPDIGRFAPWFYRVARNRSIDIIRQRKREVMPDEPAVFDLMLGASDDSPADDVVERSQADRVRAALRELPDEQRRLIELAYFGGLTQSQMSSHLNIPLGTIKTRVRTGLHRLRELLEH